MEAAAVAKTEEKKKGAHAASESLAEPRVSREVEAGAKAGMPLFLQRSASSAASLLVQRQMEEAEEVEETPEEQEEELIQPRLTSADKGFIQRQAVAEEEKLEETPEETTEEEEILQPQLTDTEPSLIQRQEEEEAEELEATSEESEEEQLLQPKLTNTQPALIQRQEEEEENELEDIPEKPEQEEELLQPKLTIGQPGDVYEQEADQVADVVMGKVKPPSEGQMLAASPTEQPQVQRKCAACEAEEKEQVEDEEEEKTVQRKASGNSSTASQSFPKDIQPADAGISLSSHIREKVEPVLGTDLSDVRVHSSPSDRSLARSLGAKAFTHKHDIWVGENQSPDDLELMAHEASHVAQQTSGSAPVQRLQRKPSDYQHPEDGGGVQSRLNSRFEEEIGDLEAATERGDESGSSHTSRSIDRAEVRSRSGELQGETRPDVDRPAKELPQVEQAAEVTQKEAESPPEQMVEGESAAEPELTEGAGEQATDAAEQASGLAEQAFAAAAAQPEPNPEVEVQPPEPIEPVDAAGEPLDPDPEADTAIIDIAERIQYLRERGSKMRVQAAEGHSNAEIIRGNVARVSSEVSKAEQGITTAQEHSQYRREVIDQAEQALEVSQEKQATVAAQSPGFQSKADEGKEDSGPMASEASSLVSENASNTPDDSEAAEKSREQGQKMNRVSSDAVTMDSAISQTRSRADSLVEDAAHAAELNTKTSGQISSGQQQLEQTNQLLSQHQAQTSQARGQLEGMAGAADALHAQATQLDEQGKQIIASSFALEERLRGTQQSYAAGTNAIPAVKPWEGEIPGAAEEATIQMQKDENQSSEVAPAVSTTSENVPTTPASLTPNASTSTSVIPTEESTSVSESSVATGLEAGASAVATEASEEAPAAQPETAGEGETTAVTEGTTSGTEEEGPATTDIASDLTASVELGPRQERVSLESEIPPWLTGADPRSVQEREQRQQQLDNQRRQEVAWFNQELGGRSVAQIGTGERFHLVGRALGRRFQNITKNIKWPGWGGLAKMLLDPRSHLAGIVGGLSMILSGGSNLLSAEQWRQDPLGNLLTSAANIATGIAIILGTITAIAGLVIAVLGALILLSFGALAAPFAPIIAFCTTVITTVGGWAIAAGKIALVLQALALIKNLIDVATAQTADQLQRETEEVSGNISGSFQAVMSIVGAKGAQAGLSKLSSRVSRVTAAREAVGRSSRALARQTFARGGQAVGRGALAVGRGIGRGPVAVGRGIGRGAVAVGRGIGRGAMAIGRGVATVGRGIRRGAAAVGRGIVAGGRAIGGGVRSVRDRLRRRFRAKTPNASAPATKAQSAEFKIGNETHRISVQQKNGRLFIQMCSDHCDDIIAKAQLLLDEFPDHPGLKQLLNDAQELNAKLAKLSPEEATSALQEIRNRVTQLTIDDPKILDELVNIDTRNPPRLYKLTEEARTSRAVSRFEHEMNNTSYTNMPHDNAVEHFTARHHAVHNQLADLPDAKYLSRQALTDLDPKLKLKEGGYRYYVQVGDLQLSVNYFPTLGKFGVVKASSGPSR